MYHAELMSVKLFSGEIWQANGCCCDLQEIGSSLSVQALNAANVPLAVDKCINFIALYGQLLLFFFTKYFC